MDPATRRELQTLVSDYVIDDDEEAAKRLAEVVKHGEKSSCVAVFHFLLHWMNGKKQAEKRCAVKLLDQLVAHSRKMAILVADRVQVVAGSTLMNVSSSAAVKSAASDLFSRWYETYCEVRRVEDAARYLRSHARIHLVRPEPDGDTFSLEAETSRAEEILQHMEANFEHIVPRFDVHDEAASTELIDGKAEAPPVAADETIEISLAPAAVTAEHESIIEELRSSLRQLKTIERELEERPELAEQAQGLNASIQSAVEKCRRFGVELTGDSDDELEWEEAALSQEEEQVDDGPTLAERMGEIHDAEEVNAALLRTVGHSGSTDGRQRRRNNRDRFGRRIGKKDTSSSTAKSRLRARLHKKTRGRR
mmetsp:Transcript_11117/g.34079  ORF Transcript_11117/g.34079 Transcript_11117/m.34079 type:complete len:365 (+) Transcript_11117:207-1301(+)